VPPAKLTDDLGLAASGPRPRDQAGWTAPKKVVVAASWAERGPGGGLEALRHVAPGVEIVVTGGADAAKAAADADAVLGFVNESVLAAAPKLRWAQVSSAGVERYVGLPRIKSGEVVLTNAQRLYGPEIADHAVGMLLALTRAFPAALQNQNGARKWELPAAARDAMVELRGKTVLVAGLGGIGREVAQRVAGFGARVLATQARPTTPPPFVERVGPPEDLLAMAAEADVVFVCVPLTPQTELLFDEEFFVTVKRGARFINVARGRCVDQAALVAALKDGRIAGAGLDVTDPEPLPPDHELWKLPNVILTPHDSAASDGADERLFLLVRENLRRFVAGEALLSVVDPAQGH
jgi:phosphoglycerate dehydrogenase-like enzyme